MDEGFFQSVIDVANDDSAARMLFAEWLGDRGDERSAGYAWMGERHKSPSAIPSSLKMIIGERWSWFILLSPDIGHSNELPADVMSRMPLHKSIANGSGSVKYKTRRDAEEAICFALIEVGSQS